ncbi:MAG: mandelate racemase/muconate lactonizing enzyme family protein [Lachnospiraceae bacterium]|nr:mandelate racemase/muconate lactonizing enzyme family protein [Lachnospiraceae bacterium]
MKITDVKAYICYPWSKPGMRNYIFCKIETDEGIHGVGEAFEVSQDTAIAEAIRYYREWLIGQDPMRTEHIWAMLTVYSRQPGGAIAYAAISAIDNALWDIKGKVAGLPVYKLLGGPARDKLLAYTFTPYVLSDDVPDDKKVEMEVEATAALIEKMGYRHIKVGTSRAISNEYTLCEQMNKIAERMEAYRSYFGDAVDLCVDLSAKTFNPARAVSMIEAIAPYKPFFVEEPIRPENIQEMAKLHRRVNVPIATGENLMTKWQFNELLDQDGADILQPDILLCGGMTEILKISHMAEARYKQIAPHNPFSPLGCAINANLCAVIPNFLILETHSHNIGESADCNNMVTNVLTPKDGYLPLPEAPGWGVDLNFEFIESHPGVYWRRGFGFSRDGAVDCPVVMPNA